MKTSSELVPGVLHVPLGPLSDQRGSFVKTDFASILRKNGLSFEVRDEFYSISGKDVIRGMHFHLPPDDHDKIVYCPVGAALDVLLDLRSGSSYGRVQSVVLKGAVPAMLFIPRGVAHGFKALQDDTLMIYKTSSPHVPASDAGILFDSFGFDWDCPAPVLSFRDQSHLTLAAFHTPFRQP